MLNWAISEPTLVSSLPFPCICPC